MDPVEKAIRNALEKGNAGDGAFREKVYRSAFAALERATKSQPQLTVEMAIRRKQNLQARIAAIEAEYLAPAPPPAPMQPDDVADALAGAVEIEGVSGPSPSVETPTLDDSRGDGVAPSVGLDGERGQLAEAPWVDLDRPVGRMPRPDGPATDAVTQGRGKRRSRRRRPFAALFMAVTFLCVLAIGGWWTYQTGLLDMFSQPEQGAPPRLAEEDDFDPGDEGPAQPGDLGGSQELRNWINVFSPTDPSSVNAPTGATAEVGQDESGQFIQIRSGSGGADVIFDVGQGVLEQIAGRKAVFDISARAEDGTRTEISISCDFGEMGGCGRKRYGVGYERGEYLFDVSLPANRPGAGGSIAINSDFSGEGKAVDIYEIKVSVVE